MLDEVSNDGPGEPLLPEIRVRLQVTLDSGHRKIKHPTKSTSNSAHLQPESLVHRLRTQGPLPHAIHAWAGRILRCRAV